MKTRARKLIVLLMLLGISLASRGNPTRPALALCIRPAGGLAQLLNSKLAGSFCERRDQRLSHW